MQKIFTERPLQADHLASSIWMKSTYKTSEEIKHTYIKERKAAYKYQRGAGAKATACRRKGCAHVGASEGHESLRN